MTTREIRVELFADMSALAHGAAEWMLATAQNQPRPFGVALSGGSTPRGLYELLATRPYVDRFPWSRAHWFWSDERFVAHNNSRSNYRMAWEAMLSQAPVPAENIHAVPTENVAPDTAALAYEDELKRFYGAELLDPVRPLFEICLLGLGADGHFASLFPGTKALNERQHWVAANTGPSDEPRITLTFPALESSHHAVFLVAGPEKADIVSRFRARDPALPVSHFHPAGTLMFLLDAAAAGDLQMSTA